MGDIGAADKLIASNTTFKFEDRLRACLLFLVGLSYDQIAPVIGASSRTIASWAKDGMVTNGERWVVVRQSVQPMIDVAKGTVKSTGGKRARNLDRMEGELDRVFEAAVNAIESAAANDELAVKLDHLPMLARARMQIQEYHQREILAARRAQERLADVLLGFSNEIGKTVMERIAVALDRVFADVVTENEGELAHYSEVPNNRAVLLQPAVVQETG